MLERMQDGPNRALALEAGGTVMARDVEAAVEAALGSKAATGLVIVISRDFDGYLAELARGLKSVALARKAIVRIAVVADPGQIEEAETHRVGRSAGPDPALSGERAPVGARLGRCGGARMSRPGGRVINARARSSRALRRAGRDQRNCG